MRSLRWRRKLGFLGLPAPSSSRPRKSRPTSCNSHLWSQTVQIQLKASTPPWVPRPSSKRLSYHIFPASHVKFEQAERLWSRLFFNLSHFHSSIVIRIFGPERSMLYFKFHRYVLHRNTIVLHFKITLYYMCCNYFCNVCSCLFMC